MAYEGGKVVVDDGGDREGDGDGEKVGRLVGGEDIEYDEHSPWHSQEMNSDNW